MLVYFLDSHWGAKKSIKILSRKEQQQGLLHTQVSRFIFFLSFVGIQYSSSGRSFLDSSAGLPLSLLSSWFPWVLSVVFSQTFMTVDRGHWIHSRLTFSFFSTIAIKVVFFCCFVFSSKELFNDSSDDESPSNKFFFFFLIPPVVVVVVCAISAFNSAHCTRGKKRTTFEGLLGVDWMFVCVGFSLFLLLSFVYRRGWKSERWA